MHKTRLSLFYLGSYLALIGLGLLFVPAETLKLLQSNSDYGDVFPRIAGMLMIGLSISVLGVIRARAEALYPGTLLVRAFFLACIAVFYWRTSDPLFVIMFVIVGLGFALTASAFLVDHTGRARQ
jgi:hypothetical protein